MRIAILSPSLTSGDAVSNDVLGMQRVLERVGKVHLFAEAWTLSEPRIFPATKIRSFLKDPGDILIYHFARGWEPGIGMLNELCCRKVVKYHNITPPGFFAPYSPGFAQDCLEGRQQLKPIAASGCELFLSDSEFNMRELVDAGAPPSASCAVSPFHDIDRLQEIEADTEVVNQFQNGQTNICTVGRLVPNKGHADLITGFAAYHHDCNSKSRLIIVGKHETRLRKYSVALRELIRQLKLEHAVVFTGEVSSNALKAYYEVADLFVTTSAHEGFCVPLIEAMAMRVPIVAYAAAAIPETVGPAGIVWEERNPQVLAESINSIVTDKSLSHGLIAKGWRRYQDFFTNERITEQFISALGKLLPERFR